jgi:hypothetical protein
MRRVRRNPMVVIVLHSHTYVQQASNFCDAGHLSSQQDNYFMAQAVRE